MKEIRYIKHDQIDAELWDQCINRAYNSVIYAYSWYLDAVCEWDALVEGDYQRVMPLPRIEKMGFELIYQPFFTQQLGLFSADKINQKQIQCFINEIPKAFKHIRLNFNSLNKFEHKHAYLNDNYELDLINNYNKLKSQYSKSQLKDLINANKNKLSLVSAIKPDDVIDLLQKNKVKESDYLKPKDYLMLKRLIYSSIYRGCAEVYGVYNEFNVLCAGAVFLLHNKKSIFLCSAISSEERDLKTLTFLLDEYIKKNSNKHLTLDFRGSNTESMAKYYQGFGAERTEFKTLVLNRFNVMQNLLYTTYQRLEKVF